MAGPNNYYVDPAINANSGAGTLGDPFGDLQYCLNTITRSTTVGDQVNIKAGTSEFPASAITLATYGSPTMLILRGYTSAANDGGQGVIDFGGASVNVLASTYGNLQLIDLKIRNNGTGTLNLSGGTNTVTHCEIEVNGQITIGNNGSGIQFSKITTSNFSGILFGYGGCFAVGNLLIHSGASYGMLVNGTGCFVLGNVIKQSHAGANGIYLLSSVVYSPPVIHNSIINTANSTGAGIILAVSAHSSTVVANNIIQGYSGAGGAAIKSTGTTRCVGAIRNNRWFNCTNGNLSTDAFVITDNSALAASPFADVSANDFRVSADVAGIGYPSSLLGASLSVNSLDIGALQRVTSGGGSLTTGIKKGIRIP